MTRIFDRPKDEQELEKLRILLLSVIDYRRFVQDIYLDSPKETDYEVFVKGLEYEIRELYEKKHAEVKGYIPEVLEKR